MHAHTSQSWWDTHIPMCTQTQKHPHMHAYTRSLIHTLWYYAQNSPPHARMHQNKCAYANCSLIFTHILTYSCSFMPAFMVTLVTMLIQAHISHLGSHSCSHAAMHTVPHALAVHHTHHVHTQCCDMQTPSLETHCCQEFPEPFQEAPMPRLSLLGVGTKGAQWVAESTASKEAVLLLPKILA